MLVLYVSTYSSQIKVLGILYFIAIFTSPLSWLDKGMSLQSAVEHFHFFTLRLWHSIRIIPDCCCCLSSFSMNINLGTEISRLHRAACMHAEEHRYYLPGLKALWLSQLQNSRSCQIVICERRKEIAWSASQHEKKVAAVNQVLYLASSNQASERALSLAPTSFGYYETVQFWFFSLLH